MSEVQLSPVFDQVAAVQQQRMPITDWGIHNASLEEVFICLATASEDQKDQHGDALVATTNMAASIGNIKRRLVTVNHALGVEFDTFEYAQLLWEGT
jgi:hypothetical protein